MAIAFRTIAGVFFTPVRGVLAILFLIVATALSSDEAVGSAGNQVCCGGWIIPWNPTPTYPSTPTPPPAPTMTTMPSGHAAVTLTQVGSPIWKPGDFQLFTAPALTEDDFFGTLDAMLPLEGPGAASYAPHAGPYDTELSTNAAAAGFVNQSVFPRSAITLDPNAVWFHIMLLPDPGVTGSSRDFASGPVIPNSLFPFSTHAEMWLDGALVETLQDGVLNLRAGDIPFDGASHRAPSQAVWHPWANDPNAGPLGSHEIRWSLRDNQNQGWNMVAAFQVIPEPSSCVSGAFGVMGVLAVGRRRSTKRQRTRTT